MTFDYASALAACAQGDRKALQRIYDQEASRLVAVALRIVHRHELAEEVVHDAFIAVWQHAGSFDPALGSARGWIYTIVRNRALNVIRDGRREDLADVDTQLEAFEVGAVITDAVEQLANTSRLRECLDQLDAQKRDSVLMSYVAGYTHGEIAGRLGVPLGTVKSWIKRGLAALKDCMA